jgi:hypothetical protein
VLSLQNPSWIQSCIWHCLLEISSFKMVMLRGRFLLINTHVLNLVSSAKATASTPVVNNEPNLTYDELYRLLANFWDNFLYPADVTQAKAINSTLFSENVQGRIDVTRTFTGRELNTEYLFGLFANLAGSSSLSLLGVPILTRS